MMSAKSPPDLLGKGAPFALAHQEDVEGMLDAGADDCLLGSMDDDALDARIAVAERAARRIPRKPCDEP